MATERNVIIMETENLNQSEEALPVHHRISHLPLETAYCAENADALEASLQELNELFSAVGVEI